MFASWPYHLFSQHHSPLNENKRTFKWDQLQALMMMMMMIYYYYYYYYYIYFITIAMIMKSTKVQTLGGNIGTFGLETPICMHMYILGIYRTSFQHNLHCFIDACVHVVNDYN